MTTDRHIMQGFIELSEVTWKSDKLIGKAEMVADEPMKIVIAK